MCVAGSGLDDGGEGDGALPDAGDGSIDIDARVDGGAGEGGLDATLLPDGSLQLPDGAIVGPDGGIIGGADGSIDGGDAAVVLSPVACVGVGSPLDCVCGIGQTKCDATLSCVDTNTDHENCGTCGNACAVDQFCNLGVCDLIGTPPVELCGGLCIDFTSDNANCGSCGAACPAAAACIDSRVSARR